MKISGFWKYIRNVTVSAAITSTIVMLFFWLILGGDGHGERGMGDGLLLITVGLAVAFSGVIALFSSFLSGFIIYRVNPQSAIGESLTLGVISGVMLIILLIPAWFAFIIFWGSVGGNSLVLVVSLVFGTVVCLSIAKIRSLLLY